MERLLILGDIHGELSKLKKLFSKLKPKEDDAIIFLGDYLDRGPDSRGVIDFIIELQKKFNVITLLANHEDMAVQSYKAIRGEMSKLHWIRSWMINGGRECLMSYDPEAVKRDDIPAAIETMFEIHGDFFKNLRLTYETENHIFVHGFLSPHLDVEEQQEFSCLWGRYEEIHPHKSGKTVVVGHTVQRDSDGNFAPKDDGFKIGIDTGSFKRDGFITAMVIEGNKTKFVDSK